MKLFTKSDDIKAAIEDIRTTGKKLDNMIQVAAVSVIAHIEKHGDITLLNTLVDAMPKGSRVNALRDFLLTFGKVAYSEEQRAFVYDRAAESDVQGAMAIMWTEFKPEPAYEAFDLKGLLASVLKKAETALGNEHRDEVDLELVGGLRMLVAAQDVPDELVGTV